MSDRRQCPASESAPARQPLPHLLACGVLLFAVFVSFFPCLSAEFIDWDDQLMFTDNYRFRGLSPRHLGWMFTTLHMGHYQPLSWVTLGLDYLLFGMNPAGYHLTNLLIHGANAVLVYALTLRILAVGARPDSPADARRAALCSLLGALFFAIHPLRVEPVAWVTERRDVLSAAFYIGAAILYLRWHDAPAETRAKWRALCLLSALLSLLAKAWAVTLPVVLWVLDAYPLRRTREGRRLLAEKVPFFALAVVFGLVAVLAQARAGAMTSLAEHGPGARILQSVNGLAFYLVKTVCPARLSPLYPLDSTAGWSRPESLLSLGLVVCGAAALALSRRRRPWAWPAFACYAAVLAPVLGWTQSGPQRVADRYSYLSCIPFAVWLGAGLFGVRRCGLTRTTVPTAAAVLALVALGTLTRRQADAWRTGVSLWTHALALDPSSAFAHKLRGDAWVRAGNRDAALRDYEAAIRLDPRHARAYHARANLRQDAGQFEAAAADYDAAVSIDPSLAMAFNGRGTLRHARGDAAGARADFCRAIDLDPKYAEAYSNRGNLEQAQGRLAAALADYHRAIALNPCYADALFNRANLLVRQANWDRAMADLNAALDLNPSFAEAYNSRGQLLRRFGHVEAALRDYEAAALANPRYVQAHVNLGTLLEEMGRPREAEHHVARALELAPADWEHRARLVRRLELIRWQARGGATNATVTSPPSPPASDRRP